MGWATPPQQIIFEFDSLQQFGSVTVHAYMNSPGVTWFGSVEVSISQDKEQWNTFSFETDDRQGPQDITIQTQMDSGIAVEGRYVRLIFGNTQGSGPMLISEVSFNSTVGEFVCNSLCFNIRILNLLLNLNHCPLAPSLCFSTSKYFRTSTHSTDHSPVGRSTCSNGCTDHCYHHCIHCYLLHREEEEGIGHGTKVRCT